MKKIFSTLVVLLLMGCSTMNDKNVITKDENVPDYLAINHKIINGTGKHTLNQSLKSEFVGKKVSEYKKGDQYNYTAIKYDKYGDTYNAISDQRCVMRTYTDTGKSTEKDLCITDGYEGIQDVAFTKNYIAVSYGLGKTNPNKKLIKVFDRNYNMIQEINVDKEVLDMQLLNNDIYFIDGIDTDDNDKSSIKKYNIITKKQKVIYTGKNKDGIEKIILNGKNVYVYGLNAKKEEYKIDIIENKKRRTVKSFNETSVYFDEESIYKGNRTVKSATFMSNVTNEVKYGILTIENGQIKIYSDKNAGQTSLNNNFYFKENEDMTYNKTSVVTFKTEKINIPYPKEKESTTLYFFKKKSS